MARPGYHKMFRDVCIAPRPPPFYSFAASASIRSSRDHAFLVGGGLEDVELPNRRMASRVPQSRGPRYPWATIHFAGMPWPKFNLDSYASGVQEPYAERFGGVRGKGLIAR